jgi:hypothetical protein
MSGRRSRPRRAALLFGGMGSALMLLAARPAAAFKFQEHAAIGDRAMSQACAGEAKALMAALKVADSATVGDDAAAAFCSALLLPGGRSYGTVSAMSGDNIPSPYLFVDNLSRVEAVTVSTTDYLLLAHENQDHFQPDSVATYRFWHRTAIQAAFTLGSATLLDPASLRRRFEEILIFNAFADHFLSDSFAAGHIRVDRKRLSDRVSKNLHDFDNQANVGRHAWWVKNQLGDVWWPVGDGQWEAMDQKDQARVVEAVQLSIQEVIEVFVDVVGALNRPKVGDQPRSQALEKVRNEPTMQRDDSYRALPLIPLRPQCAEQSMLGDQPCYRLTSYAESFIVGAAGNVHFTDRENTTSWSVDLAKPLFSFLGFFLRTDVHTDIRYDAPGNVTTGQGAWLTGVTPGIFGRLLPSPQASHGSEFSFAIKIGVPILIAPDARGRPDHLQPMALYIPDVNFTVGRLFYSLDLNLEFGYGAFLAYRPAPAVGGATGATGATILGERGAELGISTHFAIF